MTRAPKTGPKAKVETIPEAEVTATPAAAIPAADATVGAPTPGHLAVEEARRSLDAAREAAQHATAAVDLGRQAIPEVAGIARTALDEQVERLRTQGHEAADVALDQMEIARELIITQVKARPITSALAAVGAGFVLGVLLSGRRR